MKTINLLFAFLISYAASAQDKTTSVSKDTVGETKVSPITEAKQIQPSKVIICGPSKSALVSFYAYWTERL